MGLISTEMMKQWLGFYPGLFTIAIILKQFLDCHGLNDSYTGGLSSYCLLILIISGLKDQDERRGSDYPYILSSFLKYFG